MSHLLCFFYLSSCCTQSGTAGKRFGPAWPHGMCNMFQIYNTARFQSPPQHRSAWQKCMPKLKANFPARFCVFKLPGGALQFAGSSRGNDVTQQFPSTWTDWKGKDPLRLRFVGSVLDMAHCWREIPKCDKIDSFPACHARFSHKPTTSHFHQRLWSYIYNVYAADWLYIQVQLSFAHLDAVASTCWFWTIYGPDPAVRSLWSCSFYGEFCPRNYPSPSY